jgi:Cu(I)/Ag(I) efflux system membrane fusion protein
MPPQIPLFRRFRLASAALPRFVVLGALLLASCRQNTAPAKPENVDYYTCTMHPSVRSQDPKGKCPICSMGLVPVFKKTVSTGTTNASAMAEDEKPSELVIPLGRQQEIGVTYAKIARRQLSQTIRAAGVVDYDKHRHWDYVSRVDGYVKDLSVFSRGEAVEKGAPLLAIYSPELLTTEREFVDLLAMRDRARTNGLGAILESSDRLLDGARERLRLWNIDSAQIARLEQTRQPEEILALVSPFQGVVQTIAVDQGRKVMPGDHLVDVADLSEVWVWAEFYESEISLLKTGLPVVITAAAYPGVEFKGKVSVVDPFINDALRAARVRVDLENADLRLRPEMYVNAELAVDFGEKLAVPVEAVLPTGARNIVFVEKGAGRLEPRFIQLGRKFGDYFEIQSGLKEGERVATSANFLIDAEARVEGALKSW